MTVETGSAGESKSKPNANADSKRVRLQSREMSESFATTDEEGMGGGSGKKKRRTKKGVGKACIYCRRSHMVCEGGRPCERCIKREIPHLCRDFTPPRQTEPAPETIPPSISASNAAAGPSSTKRASTSQDNAVPSYSNYTPSFGGLGNAEASSSTAVMNPGGTAAQMGIERSGSVASNSTSAAQMNLGMMPGSTSSTTFSGMQGQIPLYSDPNFPPAWPLLTDTPGPVTYGDGSGLGREQGEWGVEDETELGALSKFLGDLGVPNLPGGFLDVLSYFSKGGGNGYNASGVPMPGIEPGGISEIDDNIAEEGGIKVESTSLDMDSGAWYDANGDYIGPSGASGSASGSNVNTAGVESNFQGSGSLTGTEGFSAPDTTDPTAVGGSAPTAASSHMAPPPFLSRTNSGLKGTLTSSAKGKGKETPGTVPQLGNLSRIERYFLAAADQPSGPRSSRLAQVIKAKYDAGLLRPYDYVKGYERMKGWMDSGRANPRDDSRPASAPGSPVRLPVGVTKLRPLTSAAAAATGVGSSAVGSGMNTPGTSVVAVRGQGISAESRRRIWAAMNGFRPKFRQIARTLTEVDLVFIEEAMERWMLQYDRAFASIHTPSCIWRRTGEIQKANQEFANLTGIPASMFRNGQLCVYELMDEDSAVRYWEGYAAIAFDAGQRSLYIPCTLKIPISLTRLPPRQPFATPPIFGMSKTAAPAPPNINLIPDLSLPQGLIQTANGIGNNGNGGGGGGGGNDSLTIAAAAASHVAGDITPGKMVETFREIKCCFSVTIRRDAWGVPVAIMGQWIPI